MLDISNADFEAISIENKQLKREIAGLREQINGMTRAHIQETIAYLEALKNRFGSVAVDTIEDFIAEKTKKQWRQISEQLDSNGIVDLLNILGASVEIKDGVILPGEDNDMEAEQIDAKVIKFSYGDKGSWNSGEFYVQLLDDGIMMKITRCRICNLMKEMGLASWGYSINCIADPYIAEGFNPNIGFRRTKTLMQGQECCDNFYYLKE